MDNKVKDIIKISQNLDDAVLKGFNRGKEEKKSKKRKVILKRTSIVAGVIVASTTLVGIINPEIVKSIPIVGDIFGYFNDGVYKQSAEKYEELGQLINTSVVDNNVTVTLNKAIVDDNIFIASLLIESDKLLGYDEMKKPRDFINPNFEVMVNGEQPSVHASNITIINERTAAVVLEYDISKIDLNSEVKVNLALTDIYRGRKRLAKGEWSFDIKLIKGKDSRVYNIGEELILNDTNVTFEKLVSSDLLNRLYLVGKCDNYESLIIGNNDFILKDNTGRELLYELTSGVTNSNGNFEFTVDILSDLRDVEYIEIVKSQGNEPIIKEMNNWRYRLLKASSSDEANANRANEIISRKPSKEEKKDGYALDNVTYNLDIDRSTAFQSIDDLIGKEIAVNSTDKVIVQDIIEKDDYTDVVIKIDGNYDYRLLGSLVLFDEDMNDVCRFEGSDIVLTDIDEKIVTIKRTKINPNRKYTIAVPVSTELIIDKDQMIKVELKQ